MIVDAHHHFWRYNPAEYGWMSDQMEPIRRDFLPADLEVEIAAAGVDGVVSVQARQSLAETAWLCDLADEHEFIRGVVGWVPLTCPTVRDELARLAGRKPLKAVRHVLHDEADDAYMLREDFNAGITALREFGLAYDILIFERHLPRTIEFVDRHPGLVFVVDHVAKPRIREGAISPWRENLAELARRENVYCKLSGMVTEADWHAWTAEQLRPYIEVVLDAFGPGRVMFGSDWPVCRVACGYDRWLSVVKGFIASLSADERARILGGTAVEAYRL